MKKLLALSFVAAMLCSCAGCAGGSSGSSAADPGTLASAPKEKADGVTLRILLPGNVQSFYEGENENNNGIHAYLQELTGYQLDYRILPTEGADEKLTLEIASGDPADMIYISANRRDTFLQFATNGYLMELDSYIAHTPELQSTDCMKPEVRKMAMVDGKQYAVATPSNGGATTYSLGGLYEFQQFKQPGGMSLENIKKTFGEIKKQYPGRVVYTGDGAGTGNYQLASFDWLYGAFGLATPFREKGDGTLEYSATTQDMLDCLTYIADLHSSGYIDPEYAVLKTERVQEKLVSGLASTAGVGWYSWPGYALTLSEGNAYDLYGNAEGPDGRTGQTYSTPNHGYCVVTASSKYPQEALNYIAAMCRPDVYDYLFYGTEGKDYEVDANGDWILKLEDGNRNSPKGNMNFYVYYYIYENIEQRTLRLSRLAYGLPEKINIHNHYPSLKSVNDPAADMPSIEIYNQKIADVNALCAEYFLKIATGALPTSAFHEFLTRFDQIGGNDVVAAVNEWYTNKTAV